MTADIITTRDGAVMRLTFNRPDKKNAITAAMYAALADGLEAAETDDAIRAVLFDSNGDFFTAGNDIADFMATIASPPPDHETPSVMRFLEALARAETPLIAAVNGPAVGVGVTMLFHCDLVYASDKATFHTPFVDLGLVPEASSSLLLPRLAGHQRAAEMLIAAKKIDAARAVEFGFVNEVTAPAALLETAETAVQGIVSKAPAAVALTKKLMKRDRDVVLEHMRKEGALFNERLKSDEFREAAMAFMQKRKPDFSKAG